MQSPRPSGTFAATWIPGAGVISLPGVFTLVDSLSDRHIVRIFSSDEKQVHATILAIPNSRLRSTDKTVITFLERAEGEPQAIRAWFYPGDNSGQEFAYPKKRAVELAQVYQQPVLYIPDDVAAHIAAPLQTASEPPADALRVAPLRAVTPRGEDVSVAQVIEAPPCGSPDCQRPPSLAVDLAVGSNTEAAEAGQLRMPTVRCIQDEHG